MMMWWYFLELWFTLSLQGLDAQEQLQSLTCRSGAGNTRKEPGSCIPGLLWHMSQTAGGGVSGTGASKVLSWPEVKQ